MINKVQLAGEGRFVINEKVVVYDFDSKEDGVSYAVHFEEKDIKESEAMALAEEFMKQTFDNIMKEQENA